MKYLFETEDSVEAARMVSVHEAFSALGDILNMMRNHDKHGNYPKEIADVITVLRCDITEVVYDRISNFDELR